MRLVMRWFVIGERRRFMHWRLAPWLRVRVRPTIPWRATSAVLINIVAHAQHLGGVSLPRPDGTFAHRILPFDYCREFINEPVRSYMPEWTPYRPGKPCAAAWPRLRDSANRSCVWRPLYRTKSAMVDAIDY
jgi:hypothetical protein